MIYARYTEVLYNLLNNQETKALIDEAMSEYPVYTPENPFTFSIIPTREELNKIILNHYKYCEIGFETVGRFIDELRTTLNEIMPFYYQLYKTEDVMNGLEDIFGNLDVIESFTETNSTTGESSSTSTGETTSNSSDSTTTSTTTNSYNKNVESDTPQSQLGITNKQIDNVDYANKVTWNKDTTEQSGTSTGTATTTADSTASGTAQNSTTGNIQHTLTRKGNQGVNTYAHDMGELRNIFMNITNDILNNPRLQELFMLVW